jgi:aryl-alcohol dehydrogenase-like predicted oxidoreductase
MLENALEDDCWDVVMAGFNLLNPSARMNVLPVTQARDIGFLNMIAFRQAFGGPGYVRERLGGQDWMGNEPPLGFLTQDPDVESLVEAAYRFCRWEPGVHVVLSGTGNSAHLEANVRAMEKPALGKRHLKRLEDLFALIGVRSYL